MSTSQRTPPRVGSLHSPYGNGTQIARHNGKCLNGLTHLIGPCFLLLPSFSYCLVPIALPLVDRGVDFLKFSSYFPVLTIVLLLLKNFSLTYVPLQSFIFIYLPFLNEYFIFMLFMLYSGLWVTALFSTLSFQNILVIPFSLSLNS